jgi:hypothetical protein
LSKSPAACCGLRAVSPAFHSKRLAERALLAVIARAVDAAREARVDGDIVAADLRSVAYTVATEWKRECERRHQAGIAGYWDWDKLH